VLAVIRHKCVRAVSCERVILNLMQHLSGIATLTRQYVDAYHGTHAAYSIPARPCLAAKRSKIRRPVRRGTIDHRLDLASGILIKNNHIAGRA